MQTTKRTRRTNTQLSTFVAKLRSISRGNSHNIDTPAFCFVLNEGLKLVKAPIINPIIHSSSSIRSSDSFQVLHDDGTTIEAGDDLFADIVVCPSHKPFLSTRDFFEQSSGSSCAFGLKLSTEMFKSPFHLLDLTTTEESSFGGHSQVVYSEVDTENLMQVRNFGINLFGECEHKKTSILSVNSEETFIDVPREIFFITLWNSERDFDSSFDGSNAQNVIFQRCRPWEIISHTASRDNWFGLSIFDHTAGLFDTGDCQLTLKTTIFESPIYKGMEFDIILDISLPSFIDAQLHSFGIETESLDYFYSRFNSYLRGCPNLHIFLKQEAIFKTIGGRQFIPRLKSWVSLPYVS